MISSMTGFGTCTKENPNFESTVEIRTLNSRFLDVSIRLPKAINGKEMEIRNIITEKLIRGKVTIEVEIRAKNDPITSVAINKELFKQYYEQLRRLADSVIAPHDDLFRIAIQSPDVMMNETKSEQAEQAWQISRDCLMDALKACDEFRLQEGKALESKFKEYVNTINDLLKKIDEYEPGRIKKIKDRLTGNLQELIGNDRADVNRLEQEIIYYIEKIDISEEKVRLGNHLGYFIEVLEKEDNAGKKLGFISQEIGREINTIGSKANDPDIQMLVVGMKDELEKIKEQLANVV
ncbi:MAG TPA: YicC/YloC family endoribonuclease [Cyclobacteriaceae bacterium]